MRNIVVDLIWKFLGYGCCRPLHSHQVNGILEDYQKRINDSLQSQLHDLRAQIFEYSRQEAEREAARVMNVRLVK